MPFSTSKLLTRFGVAAGFGLLTSALNASSEPAATGPRGDTMIELILPHVATGFSPGPDVRLIVR